ncbi:MAG: hypothetical protein VKN33_09835 [Candidatus Sericytochromatia bacterium]|nr:hypothetical protein [Candidatus Sericytochromatia bacterium]
MTPRETEEMLHLLAEANPSSVFMEVAFLESWVAYYDKERRMIDLRMLAGSLSFFESEFRWRPRLATVAGAPRPAWAGLAATLVLAGVLIGTL